MSALALTQNATAVAVNVPASFLATGGTPPYLYSVLAGGAGGVIDPNVGSYVAPASPADYPPDAITDTIQVVDAAAATATATIMVGTPLLLFCDIIQQGLGLANGRVYLWNQKISEPTDAGLFVAVSVPSCKPFGNVSRPSPNGVVQCLSMLARIDIDICSRGPDARDRKEEVVLALASPYSQQQQLSNAFGIGKLPASSQFQNLSQLDGAAIPYRYKISVNIQYSYVKQVAAAYYDTFAPASVLTDVAASTLSVISGGGISPAANLISGGTSAQVIPDTINAGSA